MVPKRGAQGVHSAREQTLQVSSMYEDGTTGGGNSVSSAGIILDKAVEILGVEVQR